MWADLVGKLAKYPSAVLTFVDAGGYPYSIRCTPEPDAGREVLRLEIPAHVPASAGPAGLLCHYHDDLLWNQTNFVATGTLERDGTGWAFRATRLVEGAGSGMSFMRQVRDGRRSAARYLTRRGITSPEIPWARLRAIYTRAQQPEPDEDLARHREGV